MSLERSDPLPPGKYWIDVIDVQHQQDFAAWLVLNKDNVKVLKTEHFDANDWPTCSGLDPTTGGCWPSRDWVMFVVLQAVEWNAVEFGFPNIIPPNSTVESSADTGNDPDFGDNCDIACQAEKLAKEAGSVLTDVVIGAVVIVGGIFALKAMAPR